MNSWTTSAGNQFSVKAEHTHLDKWFCYWRVHHGNENQCQWLCIPSKHMPETHKIDKVHTNKCVLPAIESQSKLRKLPTSSNGRNHSLHLRVLCRKTTAGLFSLSLSFMLKINSGKRPCSPAYKRNWPTRNSYLRNKKKKKNHITLTRTTPMH